MYRFLWSRQWVVAALVALASIPVLAWLGLWQLHRHESRVAHNRQIAAGLAAAPVPVTDLTAPGRPVPREAMWRTVRARGRFDTRHEVVVRRREAADRSTVGYYVQTPLVLGTGPRRGDAVLVNRGWIPAGGDLARFPHVPAAPAGEVTVTGRLMPDETSGAGGVRDHRGLPPRQTMLISSRLSAASTGRTLLGGYVEQSAPRPARHTPELVPPPDHSDIGPHLAYAVQWWLFAAAVPFGWAVLVRREARERAAGLGGASGPGQGSGSPRIPDTAGGERAQPVGRRGVVGPPAEAPAGGGIR